MSTARPLAYLTAVRLVANTGYRFLYPFLPVVARGLGVPVEQAGLLVSVTAFGGVATPFVTAASSRRGERLRRLAMLGIAAFAVGALVAGVAPGFVVALLGFGLIGLAKPVYDVAAQAYLSERTPYTRRARVLAILELTWAGALLIGAPASAWLIDRAGWQAPLLVFAGLGAVSFATAPVVLERDERSAVGERPQLALDRPSRALLVVMGLFSFGAELTFVAYGIWLDRDFGLSVLAVGGVTTLIALAELVGSAAVVAFGDRIGKQRSVAVGLLLAACGFGAIGATSGLVTGLAALAVGLAGFEFTIVSAIPLASEMQPQARGRYLSLMVLAVTVPRAAGAALGPLLFAAWGMAANGAGSAVVYVLAFVLLVGSVRERSAHA